MQDCCTPIPHALLCKAPACTVGEMAEAALKDRAQASGLTQATTVDKNHSERNVHRLFNRYGLALRVPVSYLSVPGGGPEAEALEVPYLKVSDFLSLLLRKYEEVVVGGLKLGPQSEELCASFWHKFQAYHPQHIVFSKLTEQERRFCIPVMIHGDKGRTLQKSPIFVCSFETPWGLPPDLLKRTAYDNRCNAKRQFKDSKLAWTCSQRLEFAGKRKLEAMQECTMECPGRLAHEADPTNSHQRHNAKGHSFLSRFLIAAIPSKTLNKNQEVLPTLFYEIAAELQELLENGLPNPAAKGKVEPGEMIRFAFIAVKGDAEFHWEAGKFTRSYHKTGVKQDYMICPLCEAGRPGLSFVDTWEWPAWADTIASSDPWDEEPPLNRAPYSTTYPASLYKFDPFHCTKFGVFRDCVGSTVVRLAALEYFDFEEGQSVSVDSRLERAFSIYRLWVLAAGKNSTLKKFSRANFNYEKKRQFAWVNAKGSEITSCMMWLDFYIGQLLQKGNFKQHEDEVTLKAKSQMIQGGLTWIGIMHSHGVFLPACCARVQADSGMAFIRGYAFLAKECLLKKVAGYRLRPKIHYFHHLVFDALQELESGNRFVVSAATWLCESNEDFIGRLSRTSRRVAAKTASLRTTQRYLVKTRLLFERLLPR